MEKIFDKLSSYDILNNLIPGIFFCYLLQYVTDINLQSNSIIEHFLVYYLCGMVISRFGSIVFEPLAKKSGLIKYAKYSDYLRATKADEKINILLEVNNLYRTISASILLIFVVSAYLFLAQQFCFLQFIIPYLLATLLLVLFILSYRKQTTFIRERVEHVVQQEDSRE